METDELIVLDRASRNTAAKRGRYSVEFFHIYSDEEIGPEHIGSLDFLEELKEALPVDADLTILIDNYNAAYVKTPQEEIMGFLASRGESPTYWAYEGDLLRSAEVLMANITNRKIHKSYRQYIDKRNKYPCSLLAATWYLIRMGRLSPEGVIRSSLTGQLVSDFTPAERLINILPASYRPVEEKIRALIAGSAFASDVHMIQDLFYEVENDQTHELA